MRTRIDISLDTIERALAGDSVAVSSIVRGLQGPFFGVARRMMLDPADAEDATQEALLRVVTRLSQFRGEARFSTWAFRVAVNAFLDFRGQRYRTATLSLEQFHEDLALGLEPAAPERADDAVLLEQLKIGCGMALLGTLDADHRLAYILGEILEMEGEEAAAVLDLPAATFRKRLSRARDRVRSALESTCGVVEPSNACRCHRRLCRAKELGRVAGPGGTTASLNLPVLRDQIAKLDALARAAAFYRADPHLEPQGDLVAAITDLLRSANLQ